jgi:N-hydroxyarylamine O-acetyltransferase
MSLAPSLFEEGPACQNRRVGPSLDLAAYLARLRYAGPLEPDAATLTALHRAHVYAIPFENLDIQMGGAIRLDLASLQAKLVARRRGGYCFEQNTLFAAALRAIGFAPLTCEARVRQGVSGVRPRTHMALLVGADGESWLADVGFGGDGLLEPLRLTGAPAVQAGFGYRIAEEGPTRVLQRESEGRWEDLYAFLPEPVPAIDLEVGNWFTSTHPGSPFVRNVTAQRLTAEARHVLRNLTYTITSVETVERRDIARSELIPLLRDVFDLDLPDAARFLALDADAPRT